MAAAFASFPLASQNLPVFRGNVHGSASVTVNGQQMQVTTTNGAGTSHSATNWNSFNVGAGHGVNITQPTAQSMNISRVVTQAPSQIFGTVQSNGKFVLVNQSGITVGKGAVVDTAGFTASVLGMTEADAAAGRLRFGGDGASGPLRVEGRIYSRNGDVVLIGKDIEVGKAETVTNPDGSKTTVNGLVEAKDGSVILAAGSKVEITGRGLEGITMQVQAPSDKAVNLGTLKGDAVGIFAGQLRHSGLIQAHSLTLEGGRVVLKAQDIADVQGRIEASRTVAGQVAGGSVEVTARIAALNGEIDVRGTTGGEVNVSAQSILQGGQADASGSGKGGEIRFVAQKYIEQTASAKLVAEGGTGEGGTVHVQATAPDGAILSSGTLSADGASGGEVRVFAPNIRLMAASVHAEGLAVTGGNGGSIKVGGGRQGNDPDAPNSRYVFINSTSMLSASSRRSGKGGTLIVWSDGVTTFAGNAFARGGSEAGDGGFIEVSGKEKLTFSGMANAGAPHGARGTLLLDPKNVIIDNVSGGATGLDPEPESGTSGDFGETVMMVGGKLVITDPSNDVNNDDAGAIYVFDSLTGGLIGSFHGSNAGDRVGANVETSPFANDELLMVNSGWSNGTGAITFFKPGSLATPEVVSSFNSFTGAAEGDYLGQTNEGHRVLTGPGGTAVLFGSENWGGGKGAILKVNGNNSGMTGVITAVGTTLAAGAVDATNALVGRTTSDFIGRDLSTGEGVVFTKQDAFLLRKLDFNNNAGAVVLGNITLALIGEIADPSKNITLTGSSPNDSVGSYVHDAGATGWFIGSSNWTGAGGPVAAGALTLVRAADAGNLSSAVNGPVSAANSLLGTHAYDYVGGTVLVNEGYGYALSVASNWGGGRGAVTHIKLTGPALGDITPVNSLLGDFSDDFIGASFTDKDAYLNSWTSRDFYTGIQFLENGNYLVRAPQWHGNKGMVAHGTAAAGISGTLDVTNAASIALVGALADDRLGEKVTTWWDGSYVVITPQWNGGEGAITWGAAGTGVQGPVNNATNSLTGGRANAYLGEHVFAADGKLVAITPEWGGGEGALTVLDRVTPLTGELGTSTSAIGTPGSYLGCTASDYDCSSGSDPQLHNVGLNWWAVRSPHWGNGRGAITFIYTGTDPSVAPGASDPRGVIDGSVTGSISLVGANGFSPSPANPGDRLGGSDGTRILGRVDNNGDYFDGKVAVTNSMWGDSRGAVTMLNLAAMTSSAQQDGSTSMVGTLDAPTSASGFGDQLGAQTMWSNDGSRLIVMSSNWGNDSGAVATTDFGAGNIGTLGPGNAFVGTNPGDLIGTNSYYGRSPTVHDIGDNQLLIVSSFWGGDRGAVSLVPLDNVTGTVNPAAGGNSMVGLNAGDFFGEGVTDKHILTTSTTVVIASPGWGMDKGAITWINRAAPAGMVDNTAGTGNSLTGTDQGDDVGLGGFMGAGTANPWVTNGRGGYELLPYTLTVSPHWGNDKGAITRIEPGTVVAGEISGSNSFVGAIDGGEGDRVGSSISCYGGDCTGLDLMGNGAVVLQSYRYSDSTHSLTVFANGSPFTGVLGTANSIQYSDSEEDSGGVTFLDNNKIMLVLTGWDMYRGAVRVIDTGATLAAGITAAANTGYTNATNAFVGNAPNDRVGSGSAESFDNGNFLLFSPDYGGGQGAVTFFDVAAPRTGVISATNSLLGGAGNTDGNFSATNVYDGQVKVVSNYAWNDYRGMATVFNQSGAGNPVGDISALNALVGTNPNDGVGNSVRVLNGDTFAVVSPSWDDSTGAITWGSISGGNGTLVRDAVSSSNSLVGVSTSSSLGAEGTAFGELSSTPGRFYIGMPNTGGYAAYSFVNAGDTGVVTDHTTISSSYTGGVGFGMAAPLDLGNGMYAVRFGGDALGSSGPGQVFLTDGISTGSGPYGGGLNFSDAPDQTVTITPDRITSIINTGTDIQIQANNDITIKAAITASNGMGTPGAMFFEAGRSIHIEADIQTLGGGLSFFANSAHADSTHRDAGAGGIFTSAGVHLKLKGGNLRAEVGSGGEGGGIVLGQISEATGIFVRNTSTTGGAGIMQEAGTSWDSSTLALETFSAGGHIGGPSSGQAISFGATDLAVRSDGGSAWLHSTSPYYVKFSDTAPYSSDGVDAAPGFRGFSLGGNGSFNLVADRDIVMDVHSAMPFTAHDISLSANNRFETYANGASVEINARHNLHVHAATALSAEGYGSSGALALSANNDITFTAGLAQSYGDLVMVAGRSLSVDADLYMDGDLSLVANAPAAPSLRDSGAGGVTVAAGRSIQTYGNALYAQVGPSAGEGGSIVLGNVIGESMFLQNLSGSENAGIQQHAGSSWDVARLGMETRGANGNIGSENSPIAFSGNVLAIRTQDGSANVQHTGSMLGILSNLDGGQVGDFSGYFSLSPEFTGIQLGGRGSLKLHSMGSIDVVSDLSPVLISGNDVDISAAGDFSAIAFDGDVHIAARNRLSISAGGVVNLSASETDSAGSVRITTGGDAHIDAANLWISASAASALLSAGGTAVINVAEGVHVRGGDIGGAAARLEAGALLLSAGSVLVEARNGPAQVLAGNGGMHMTLGSDLLLEAGSGSGAHAFVGSAGNMKLDVAGAIGLQAGTGTDAYALIDPTNFGSTMLINAGSLSLQGGAGDGAYAAVVSQGGPLTLNVGSVQMTGGTGLNADAVVLAPNGQDLAAQYACAGCGYLGIGNPLLNAAVETGFGTLYVVDNEIDRQVIADDLFMRKFLDLYNDELLDRRRRGEDAIVFEQTCK